jgi:hypothetical protein
MRGAEVMLMLAGKPPDLDRGNVEHHAVVVHDVPSPMAT